MERISARMGEPFSPVIGPAIVMSDKAIEFVTPSDESGHWVIFNEKGTLYAQWKSGPIPAPSWKAERSQQEPKEIRKLADDIKAAMEAHKYQYTQDDTRHTQSFTHSKDCNVCKAMKSLDKLVAKACGK